MSFMPIESDTIAAISTPCGKGGIAVIKISGPDSLNILRNLSETIKDPETSPREMIYTKINNKGHVVDEALICFMKAPHSYTGEDVAEIQCHGGSVPAEEILRLVIENGARYSEPGEFTKRAFLNGRIDLTQAEGVMEIVNSDNREHLRKAEQLLEGELSSKIKLIIEKTDECLTDLEYNIEFSQDQSGTPVSCDKIKRNIQSLIKSTNNLLSGFKTSKRLRNGFTVIIAGKVNSGKSSLFNRLTGRKRSIVHHTEGTTRDWIEERIELDGIPFNLIDTAGLRESADVIENVGIRETTKLLKIADMVVYLHNSSSSEETLFKSGSKYINVFSKCDLLTKKQKNPDFLYVSSKTGEGVERLLETLKINASRLLQSGHNTPSLINERHYTELKKASELFKDAVTNIDMGSEEIVSYDLTEAKHSLEAILGKNMDFNIIDNIFKNFCVGK